MYTCMYYTFNGWIFTTGSPAPCLSLLLYTDMRRLWINKWSHLIIPHLGTAALFCDNECWSLNLLYNIIMQNVFKGVSQNRVYKYWQCCSRRRTQKRIIYLSLLPIPLKPDWGYWSLYKHSFAIVRILYSSNHLCVCLNEVTWPISVKFIFEEKSIPMFAAICYTNV